MNRKIKLKDQNVTRPEELRVLRLPTVMNRTGKCRAGIYADIKDGTFPRPISLGARAVGWLESEIEDWIQQKIEKRDKMVEVLQ